MMDNEVIMKDMITEMNTIKIKRARLVVGLLLMTPCLFCSCEKDLMSYEGSPAVYFKNQTVSYADKQYYSTVSLMTSVEDEMEFSLVVLSTGDTANYDRTFLVQAVADKTTAVEGVDYRMSGQGVIKAGRTDGEYIVTLLRNEKLFNEEVSLTLQLIPGGDFTADLVMGRPGNDQQDPRFYEISFSAKMEKPSTWPNYSDDNPKELTNLGHFTVKKYMLISERFGLSYDDWQDATIITSDYIVYVYTRFSKWLIEQYRNHTPVLEDDGRLMWVAGCPWTSYDGIPWDGTYDPNY